MTTGYTMPALKINSFSCGWVTSSVRVRSSKGFHSEFHHINVSCCLSSETQELSPQKNSKAVLKGFNGPLEVKDDTETLIGKAKVQTKHANEELKQLNPEWFVHKEETATFISDYIESENSGQPLEEISAARVKGKFELTEKNVNPESFVDFSEEGVEVDDNQYEDTTDEDGWGFNYSDLFSMPSFVPPSIPNDDNPTRIDEVLDEQRVDLTRDFELEDFSEVYQLSPASWKRMVYGSKIPVVICCHTNYGPESGWTRKLLEEVKRAAKLLFEYVHSPVQFVSLDVVCQPFITKELEKPAMGSLVFFKHQHKVFEVTSEVTAEEIMQLVAHFFFGAPKNAAVTKFQ